jgi:hypothetical protein
MSCDFESGDTVKLADRFAELSWLANICWFGKRDWALSIDPTTTRWCRRLGGDKNSGAVANQSGEKAISATADVT